METSARRVGGRKSAVESRGTELRLKLIEWKQIPESSRPALQALARELGTSHQLLSHYLSTLVRNASQLSVTRPSLQNCEVSVSNYRPNSFRRNWAKPSRLVPKSKMDEGSGVALTAVPSRLNARSPVTV